MTGKNKIIEPMGLDSNLGAIRAIYPLKDTIVFHHAAVGCSFYPRIMTMLHDKYYMRLYSTSMFTQHIIFGGEEVLEKALEKAVEVARPRLVVIQNTCVPALIGDDSEGVARMVSKRTGVKIISVTNPNYRGTQLDGYRNVVNAYIDELMEKPSRTEKRRVNLLGVMPAEHNWVADCNEVMRMLNALGLKVGCVLVGDGTTIEEIAQASQAEVNVLVFPEAGLAAAQRMQERFGTPYIPTIYPPIGIESSRSWLMQVADFFGIEDAAEEFFEREMTVLGRAFRVLESGPFFDPKVFSGKTYALDGSPFRIPGMVKFLYEDWSLLPYIIAFQEYEESSFRQLEQFLAENDLCPEVQVSGDYYEYREAIKKNYIYPCGDPWITFSNTPMAIAFAYEGVQMPIIRFSNPVYDEALINDLPFTGIRGVINLTEKLFNALNLKLWGTSYPMGNFPNPFIQDYYSWNPLSSVRIWSG